MTSGTRGASSCTRHVRIGIPASPPMKPYKDIQQNTSSSDHNNLNFFTMTVSTTDNGNDNANANTIPPGLPIAQLATISLAQLQRGSADEDAKLLEACRTQGFFYLDLEPESVDTDERVASVVEKMYELARELYDLPDEEKRVYDVDKLSELKLNGYKPTGRNHGGLAGQRDGFETYAIPKNGLLGLTPFARPPIITKYTPTLQAFTHLATTATSTILTSLSKSLSLPPSHSLASHHRPTAPSPDIIRLLKYAAQPATERGVPHAAHTDLGSLTFLFTRQPGLQILSPDNDEWTWVEPRSNKAVINLGDGMALLLNGYLRSCLHRVGPLPGLPMPTRYSFAYLVRPEVRTPMAGLGGPVIPPSRSEGGLVLTSAQWLRRKFGVLRLETRGEGEGWVVTGRWEEVPV